MYLLDMQISIVFGSITGESATELKWSSAACCLWANSRGRGLVKKERNLLFKSYTILEEWQASASVPIPSRTPREKPRHLLPDQSKAEPRVPSPF